jgi:hypothetical protein
MRNSKWGGSTNLMSAFKLILNQAVKFDVPESEMPNTMIILSDMEFDQSDRSWNPTTQQAIEAEYKEAGYEMPSIIYWNLASRNSNMPVQFDKDGTALISGFSPAILKGVLGGDGMDPMSMMHDVINTERYEVVVA